MQASASQKKRLSKYRGTALVTTLIFASVIGLTIGGLMHWTSLETKLNERQYLRIETQNAAESTLNYGIATLKDRWANQLAFNKNELIKDPVVLNSNFIKFLTEGKSKISRKSIAFHGGKLSDSKKVFIDPSDPANQFDPDKGKVLISREVDLYASVTAINKHPRMIVPLYTKQTLEIRDTPLFAHAVFYNMDLELNPGPNMNVYGPVHTNGNIWVSAGRSLYFHSNITAHGNLYQGYMTKDESWGSTQSGNVFIKNASGNWLPTYKGRGSRKSPNSYYDSRDPDWQSIASNRWGGNVQTVDHGISSQSAIGFDSYARDDPDTPKLDDALNFPYSIIEPNLSSRDPNYKNEGEQVKYANQAGLIIRIHDIKKSPKAPKHSVKISDNYAASFNKLKRSNSGNPASDPVRNGGNVVEIPIEVDAKDIENILKVSEYSEDRKGNPTSGFYDLRRQQAIDIVELNLKTFREKIDNTDSKYDPSFWKKNYTPASDYNNIVYVEFPTDPGVNPGKDKVYQSIQGTGLLVHEAEKVPNPKQRAKEGLTPGFTLATNNVLYLKGHFNADGKYQTGSANEPDSRSSPEPPSSLAADSIYVLSNQFDYKESKQSKRKRRAEFTEINAAFLTGVFPSFKEGRNVKSGGTHNFPRFLEDWSGRTFRYRGSMVALFESQIAANPISMHHYTPPERDWGFYSELANGNFPPGTPSVRSFFTKDFEIITESEFKSRGK